MKTEPTSPTPRSSGGSDRRRRRDFRPKTLFPSSTGRKRARSDTAGRLGSRSMRLSAVHSRHGFLKLMAMRRNVLRLYKPVSKNKGSRPGHMNRAASLSGTSEEAVFIRPLTVTQRCHRRKGDSIVRGETHETDAAPTSRIFVLGNHRPNYSRTPPKAIQRTCHTG